MPDLPALISSAVDILRDELVAFLQELVRAPSPPGREQEAQNLIAQKMKATGLEVNVVPSRFDELRHHPAFNDDGFSPDRRINVIGRRRAAGTGGGRSLILNGHMDVVAEGDLSLWEDPPWSGAVRDGRLYGRGSCDMKAGLCAALFAVEALRRIGFRPAGEVLVESVIGEESGGVGTLTTIVKGYAADAALLLEPTRLDICPVQSGALTFRMTVAGRAAHAAMKPHGVSAIEKFALLLGALDSLEAERHRGFRHALYGAGDSVAPINVGTVRGGGWPSTVPEEVVAEGRMGVLPGESTASARRALEDAMRRTASSDPWLREHPPRLEWFEGQFESSETPIDHPFLKALESAHRRLTGRAPGMRGVTYGSDMRLFTNHAGIAAAHYGPGNVLMAHAANEFVPLDEVITAAKVVALMITQWCGGAIA